MTFVHAFTWAVTVTAAALNVFIYFYPSFNAPGQCAWHGRAPESTSLAHRLAADVVAAATGASQAPPWHPSALVDGVPQDIRLLAFGDPQINGNWPSTKLVKRLDNLGNDYYLGHIYRVMSRRMQPSHVAVMGDLFSSQWIYDSEFYNRTLRYVTRLFPQPRANKQHVLDTHARHDNVDWQQWMAQEERLDPAERFASRSYRDVYDWTNRSASAAPHPHPLFINLTGNHDVGYSGDATWQHMARFHRLFGQNNYVITYLGGTEFEWRLVVLDSLSLEGPALQPEFGNYTWSFLHHLERTNANFTGSTVLLTHIPFYKREGMCTDAPFHDYYADNEREPYKNGKLRSQNHLSYDVTQRVLSIVFPNDSPGLILTGHDHEGCETWYAREGAEWTPTKTPHGGHVHEVVVRSMMGDYGGNTGVVTGQYDAKAHKWQFYYSLCPFVVQHWWWATKIITGIAVGLQSWNFVRRHVLLGP
ncbi:Calcineurin-like phosphoesterase domain-containing protein [[Candida] zeylanoides]